MQIPAPLTASALDEDPSWPLSAFSQERQRNPVQPQTHVCPRCATPPFPALLGALIGCTAGCQTTVRLLSTVFGSVLSFHMTAF